MQPLADPGLHATGPGLHAAGDADLARRCARREDGALRELIAANNQRLFRIAWSILKDRGEAEEAVQSAYLSALARIDRFEGRSSIATWLTRILINEALGRHRAAKRRKSSLERDGVAVLDNYRDKLMQGSHSETADSVMAREQLRHLLEGAIAQLPDNFRTVFVMRDVEGIGIEETATLLDIPAATVKSRLWRARKLLREALAPEVHSTLVGTFPFAGADCAAITERVLARLGIASPQ